MGTKNFFQTLERLKTRTIDSSVFRAFIEDVIKIGTIYIHRRYKNKLYLRFEETITDISTEAITPLFVPSLSGNIGLVESLNKWETPIVSETDALFFVNKITWRRVDQTIVKRFKEYDPLFGKIHKMLLNCVSKYDYSKQNYFGKMYIVHSDRNEIKCAVIPDDEIISLPIELFPKKPIESLNKLMEYIETQTNYFPAIPINILVKKIKSIYLSEFENYYCNKSHNDFLEFNVAELIDFSFDKIEKKISTQYYEKNKITSFEKSAISNAFKDICTDMKNGGLSGSLYNYLDEHIILLSAKDFYANYHGIMNYLLTNFRSELKTNLELNFNDPI